MALPDVWTKSCPRQALLTTNQHPGFLQSERGVELGQEGSGYLGPVPRESAFYFKCWMIHEYPARVRILYSLRFLGLCSHSPWSSAGH